MFWTSSSEKRSLFQAILGFFASSTGLVVVCLFLHFTGIMPWDKIVDLFRGPGNTSSTDREVAQIPPPATDPAYRKPGVPGTSPETALPPPTTPTLSPPTTPTIPATSLAIPSTRPVTPPTTVSHTPSTTPMIQPVTVSPTQPMPLPPQPKLVVGGTATVNLDGASSTESVYADSSRRTKLQEMGGGLNQGQSVTILNMKGRSGQIRWSVGRNQYVGWVETSILKPGN